MYIIFVNIIIVNIIIVNIIIVYYNYILECVLECIYKYIRIIYWIVY
jgi:hypothetical protein